MEASAIIAFRKLKPLCVRLEKKFTTVDLNNIKRCLDELDSNSLQALQEYIVFPIRTTLHKEKDSNIIIECVTFLDFVFSATTIKSWDLFWDLLGQIMRFIIFDFKSPQNASEEMVQAICHCIIAIIASSDEDILFQMYSMDYRLPLAHYLYSFLALLKQEKSKSLRLTILDCINALLYCSEEHNKTDRVESRARNRVAALLPGVSIALRNVICGDDKQGYKLFVKAIISLGEVITLTLRDNSFGDEVSEMSTLQEVEDVVPVVIRNKLWATETANRLSVILENVTTIIIHPHYKVRLALATCAHNILSNCAVNLEICILPLLQILFALSVDNYEQVSKYSQDALSKFSGRTDLIKSLTNILKDDMNIISSKLISVHLSINDQQKLSLLKIEIGYLQLLGPSVNSLLYSFAHLNRLALTLLNLVQFNISGIIFLEENIVSMDLTTTIPKLWPKKFFKYFHEEEVILRVCSICYILGFYGDIQLLVDYFIEKLHGLEHKNESIFLISNIVAGLDEKQSSKHIFVKLHDIKSHAQNSDFKIDLISNILEEFLSPESFEMSIFNCEESTEINCKLENHNADILRICLILESISNFAQILGDEFRPLLMKVLCPVMEKAGSSVAVIAQSGKLALNTFALHCGYTSVTELIMENSDYLINSITIGFCHFLQKSEMAIVLRVALEESDIDILPLFKDPINQLLLCLDYNQKKAVPIMKIFLSVVVAVKRWFPKEHVLPTVKSRAPQLDSPDIDLKSYFLELNRLKKIAMSYDCDTNSSDDESEIIKHSDNEVPYDDDEKQEPLFHVKIVSDIMERCIHYLPSENLELCVLTLSVIENSILSLRSVIDKILPCVHKLWKPLVLRFSSDHIVMKKAFETLMIIANECGDFIKSRTMKDVWPKLLHFLNSNEHTYLSKKHSSNHQLSNSYKLLVLLLSEIGKLASSLELTEKEFETLMWHCLPFLHQNQPPALQSSVSKSLVHLSKIDPDSFWFHYSEVYGHTRVIIPNSSSLYNIHFSTCESKTVINFSPSI